MAMSTSAAVQASLDVIEWEAENRAMACAPPWVA